MRQGVFSQVDPSLHDSGDIVDMRMIRLTFGVTSSPFLASKVLREVADDYKENHPRAAAVVRDDFMWMIV